MYFTPLVAQIGTDMSSYTVNEFNQDLWFEVTILNSVQKAPGQSCDIQVSTVDATAVGEKLRCLQTVFIICQLIDEFIFTLCRWSGLCTTQQNCYN